MQIRAVGYSRKIQRSVAGAVQLQEGEHPEFTQDNIKALWNNQSFSGIAIQIVTKPADPYPVCGYSLAVHCVF